MSITKYVSEQFGKPTGIGGTISTFIANVKDVDLDKIKVELIVGNKVILLDDTLYKTNVS